MGKSTLLRRLLEGAPCSVGGFYTVKTAEVFGVPSIHLLPAGKTARPNEENLLFVCGTEPTQKDAERFARLGCAALENCGESELLVMDELGPREATAEAFQSAVFSVLDGERPVLGVLQKADSVFLSRVAEHPAVEVIAVTKENRDALVPFLHRQMLQRLK